MVVATPMGTAAEDLHGCTFPLVIVDEAAQAQIPEGLMALARGAKHVVVVGDTRCVAEGEESGGAVTGAGVWRLGREAPYKALHARLATQAAGRSLRAGCDA